MTGLTCQEVQPEQKGLRVRDVDLAQRRPTQAQGGSDRARQAGHARVNAPQAAPTVLDHPGPDLLDQGEVKVGALELVGGLEREGGVEVEAAQPPLEVPVDRVDPGPVFQPPNRAAHPRRDAFIVAAYSDDPGLVGGTESVAATPLSRHVVGVTLQHLPLDQESSQRRLDAVGHHPPQVVDLQADEPARVGPSEHLTGHDAVDHVVDAGRVPHDPS